MTIQEFEKELQLINKDLAIRPNDPPKRVVEAFPDVIKLASITFRGSEVCTIPNYDIYDEPNGTYGVDLRSDGQMIRHRTRPEALEMVKNTLSRIENDKDFANQFFGTGEYSAQALSRKEAPVPELVEEVEVKLEEVSDNMIEGEAK